VTFDPASGPICLRGAPFSASYEDRASTDSLIILLDGGGACWTGFCFASDTAGGIFDANVTPISAPEADNAFGEWDWISVPYCDGSVFSGDNQVTEPDGSIRYHHGRRNLAAAIDLAIEHFPETKRILLAGFSAGGYGTIAGAIAVRLAFPHADIFVVNDSGPGIQNLDAMDSVEVRLEEWAYADVVPESCTACDGGRGQLTAMIDWTLAADPTMKVSMLSYLGDDVIGNTFLGMSDPQFEAIVLEETDKLRAAHPERLKRFMLPGDGHVLQPRYRDLVLDGVLLKDWTEAMVVGDDDTWRDVVVTSE
jgi:hypothetical protein